MHANELTITRFYEAFARLDSRSMAACYAPDAAFDDEVFSLRGREDVAGMWAMLCDAVRKDGAADWQLRFRDVQADEHAGRAHWDAHYRFSGTGRLVDNSIDARFGFTPGGLIAQHRDHFDFWRWSRQALGAPGLLLGWTPMLRRQVRTRAAANLRRSMQKGAQ